MAVAIAVVAAYIGTEIVLPIVTNYAKEKISKKIDEKSIGSDEKLKWLLKIYSHAAFVDGVMSDIEYDIICKSFKFASKDFIDTSIKDSLKEKNIYYDELKRIFFKKTDRLKIVEMVIILLACNEKSYGEIFLMNLLEAFSISDDELRSMKKELDDHLPAESYATSVGNNIKVLAAKCAKAISWKNKK